MFQFHVDRADGIQTIPVAGGSAQTIVQEEKEEHETISESEEATERSRVWSERRFASLMNVLRQCYGSSRLGIFSKCMCCVAAFSGELSLYHRFSQLFRFAL